MKLTNKNNLPQVFVNLVQRMEYSRGASHVSMTELINAPQKSILKQQYKKHLIEDVSDRYYAILGTLMHKVLEIGIDDDDKTISEERLFFELNKWKISGAIDVQIIEEDGVILQDYKFVGVFSVMLGEQPKPDWVNQLNAYAWLVRKAKGLKVKKLEIITIFRDFKNNGSQQNSDYPETPIQRIDIPLWDDDTQDKFIEERIKLHQTAVMNNVLGKPLPSCLPQDTWEKPTKYAILKKDRKRAIKVFDDKKEAEKSLKQNDHDDYYLEERKGEPTFCIGYCPVSSYCEQHQAWRKENEAR